MFSINSTITRDNGVRKTGTLIPQLEENVVYEPYRGFEKIRSGTLYLFLNRYDPATTMRDIYKFKEPLIEQVMSKLTYCEVNPNRASAAYDNDFDYAPSKAEPSYKYAGHGFYSEWFNGNIIPIMYHWVAVSDDINIIERFLRINSEIIDDTQRFRRSHLHYIPDDIVVNNGVISNMVDPSFEGSARADILFKYVASSVSALSPTCAITNFNNIITRMVERENYNYRDSNPKLVHNCKTVMNAMDHYKHYFA